MGNLRNSRYIRKAHDWIARGLGIHQFCFRCDCRFQFFEIGHIHFSHLDSHTGEQIVGDLSGAGITDVTYDKMVAGRKVIEQQCGHCRHSASEGNTGIRILQYCKLFFHLIDCRIRPSCIEIRRIFLHTFDRKRRIRICEKRSGHYEIRGSSSRSGIGLFTGVYCFRSNPLPGFLVSHRNTPAVELSFCT